MTLKQYIKTSGRDIPELAASLGVSAHGFRKWVYNQRAPTLEMALRIVAACDGKVDLSTLVKTKVAA